MFNWKLIKEFRINEFQAGKDLYSHAQLPTPLVVSENLLRIFFAARNINQESSIYSIDVLSDSDNGELQWGDFSLQPILTPGQIGDFDEHGVYPSRIIKVESDYYMYFIGWIRGFKSPLFYSSIGIANSKDGFHFNRMFRGPSLSKGQNEPFLVTSPFVDAVGSDFEMHYVSGEAWVETIEGIKSRYDIKSIKSSNPLDWNTQGRKSVLPLEPGETNIARPWLHTSESGDRYLFYCFLKEGSSGYKIGVAKLSKTGEWERFDDEVLFQDLPKLEMICYPAVVRFAGKTLLLVNGNEYGREGFYILALQEP